MTRSTHTLSLADIATASRGVFEDTCRTHGSRVYLGDNTALCRIMSRYKLYVSTRDDGFASNVMLDGYWESWLTRYMARQVRPGQTAVDVGANYGYYSLLLADLVGTAGQLFAIEPSPDIVPLLSRSLLLNGFAARSEVLAVAAGNADGDKATLAVPAREPKNGNIVAAEFPQQDGEVRHEVTIRSLDSLLAKVKRIDFIKIDAEGAEEAIIDGMEGIIVRDKPNMVLEYNAARYANPEGFLQKLLRFYGTMRYIEYDASTVPISSERVLNERPGEDWLLVFGGR